MDPSPVLSGGRATKACQHEKIRPSPPEGPKSKEGLKYFDKKSNNL
jgi:hypothetical protein